jgi:hypothetical protein
MENRSLIQLVEEIRDWFADPTEARKMINRIRQLEGEHEIAIKLYAKARKISIDEARENVSDAYNIDLP